MTPPEPVEVGKCAYCGDEIYAGDPAYQGDDGLTHRNCILGLMLKKLGVDYMACMCNYQEVIAR